MSRLQQILDVNDKSEFQSYILRNPEWHKEKILGNEVLTYAARVCFYEFFKVVVEARARANGQSFDHTIQRTHVTSDNDKKLLIHDAAIGNNADVVKGLIGDGVEVDVLIKRARNTALHLAVYNNSDDACNALIDAGADLSIENARGLKAESMSRNNPIIDFRRQFFNAIKEGKQEDITACLKRNSTVICLLRNKKNALFYAAERGQMGPFIKACTAFSADRTVRTELLKPIINAHSDAGETLSAVWLKNKSNDNPGCLGFLQAHGMQKRNHHDRRNSTLIHIAVEHDRTDLLKNLIIGREDLLNRTNRDGDTPLDIAIKKGDVEAVKILCEAGAKDTTTENFKRIIEAGFDDEKKIGLIKTLLAHRDRELTTNEIGTLIHLAIEKQCSVNVIRNFAELKNANLKEPLPSGNLPLWHAARYQPNNVELVDALERWGADVSIVSSSKAQNFLFRAALASEAMVHWAIEKGVSLTAVDDQRRKICEMSRFAHDGRTRTNHVNRYHEKLRVYLTTERGKKPDHYRKEWLFAQDKDGDYLIHHAASAGNLDALKEMQEMCTEDEWAQLVNQKNEKNESPLDYAVSKRHSDAVSFLCEAGAKDTTTKNLERVIEARFDDERKIGLIKTLLAHREQELTTDEIGSLILLAIEKQCSVNVIRNFAELKNADMNWKASKGSFVLWDVCECQPNNTELSEALVGWGADVQTKVESKNGSQNLMFGATLASEAMVHWCVDKGVSLKEIDQKSNKASTVTAFLDGPSISRARINHVAAYQKKLKAYVKKGAKKPDHYRKEWLFAQDKDGYYLIHHAATAGNLDALKEMRGMCSDEEWANIVNIKKYKKSPLACLLENEGYSPAALDFLLDNGAKETELSSDTIFELLSEDQKHHRLSTLSERCPGLVSLHINGEGLLHRLLRENASQGSVDLALKYGADVSVKKDDKALAFHTFRNVSRPPLLRYEELMRLITAGNVNRILGFLRENNPTWLKVVDEKTGLTPIHVLANLGHSNALAALLKEYPELVKQLLDQRDETDEKRTPLMHAVDKKHAGVVECILAQKVNVDYQDSDGNSALHLAALANKGEAETRAQRIVALLEDAGISTQLRNRAGKTAAEIGPSFLNLLTQTNVLQKRAGQTQSLLETFRDAVKGDMSEDVDGILREHEEFFKGHEDEFLSLAAEYGSYRVFYNLGQRCGDGDAVKRKINNFCQHSGNNLETGEAFIHHVIRNRDSNLLDWAIQHDADVNLRPSRSESRPLWIAVKVNSIDSVTKLLTAKANPNGNPADVSSPLSHAVNYQREAIAEALLCAGADPLADVHEYSDNRVAVRTRPCDIPNGYVQTKARVIHSIFHMNVRMREKIELLRECSLDTSELDRLSKDAQGVITKLGFDTLPDISEDFRCVFENQQLVGLLKTPMRELKEHHAAVEKWYRQFYVNASELVEGLLKPLLAEYNQLIFNEHLDKLYAESQALVSCNWLDRSKDYDATVRPHFKGPLMGRFIHLDTFDYSNLSKEHFEVIRDNVPKLRDAVAAFKQTCRDAKSQALQNQNAEYQQYSKNIGEFERLMRDLPRDLLTQRKGFLGAQGSLEMQAKACVEAIAGLKLFASDADSADAVGALPKDPSVDLLKENQAHLKILKAQLPGMLQKLQAAESEHKGAEEKAAASRAAQEEKAAARKAAQKLQERETAVVSVLQRVNQFLDPINRELEKNPQSPIHAYIVTFEDSAWSDREEIYTPQLKALLKTVKEQHKAICRFRAVASMSLNSISLQGQHISDEQVRDFDSAVEQFYDSAKQLSGLLSQAISAELREQEEKVREQKAAENENALRGAIKNQVIQINQHLLSVERDLERVPDFSRELEYVPNVRKQLGCTVDGFNQITVSDAALNDLDEAALTVLQQMAVKAIDEAKSVSKDILSIVEARQEKAKGEEQLREQVRRRVKDNNGELKTLRDLLGNTEFKLTAPESLGDLRGVLGCKNEDLADVVIDEAQLKAKDESALRELLAQLEAFQKTLDSDQQVLKDRNYEGISGMSHEFTSLNKVLRELNELVNGADSILHDVRVGLGCIEKQCCKSRRDQFAELLVDNNKAEMMPVDRHEEILRTLKSVIETLHAKRDEKRKERRQEREREEQHQAGVDDVAAVVKDLNKAIANANQALQGGGELPAGISRTIDTLDGELGKKNTGLVSLFSPKKAASTTTALQPIEFDKARLSSSDPENLVRVKDRIARVTSELRDAQEKIVEVQGLQESLGEILAELQKAFPDISSELRRPVKSFVDAKLIPDSTEPRRSDQLNDLKETQRVAKGHLQNVQKELAKQKEQHQQAVRAVQAELTKVNGRMAILRQHMGTSTEDIGADDALADIRKYLKDSGSKLDDLKPSEEFLESNISVEEAVGKLSDVYGTVIKTLGETIVARKEALKEQIAELDRRVQEEIAALPKDHSDKLSLEKLRQKQRERLDVFDDNSTVAHIAGLLTDYRDFNDERVQPAVAESEKPAPKSTSGASVKRSESASSASTPVAPKKAATPKKPSPKLTPKAASTSALNIQGDGGDSVSVDSPSASASALFGDASAAAAVPPSPAVSGLSETMPESGASLTPKPVQTRRGRTPKRDSKAPVSSRSPSVASVSSSSSASSAVSKRSVETDSEVLLGLLKDCQYYAYVMRYSFKYHLVKVFTQENGALSDAERYHLEGFTIWLDIINVPLKEKIQQVTDNEVVDSTECLRFMGNIVQETQRMFQELHRDGKTIYPHLKNTELTLDGVPDLHASFVIRNNIKRTTEMVRESGIWQSPVGREQNVYDLFKRTAAYLGGSERARNFIFKLEQARSERNDNSLERLCQHLAGRTRTLASVSQQSPVTSSGAEDGSAQLKAEKIQSKKKEIAAINGTLEVIARKLDSQQPDLNKLQRLRKLRHHVDCGNKGVQPISVNDDSGLLTVDVSRLLQTVPGELQEYLDEVTRSAAASAQRMRGLQASASQRLLGMSPKRSSGGSESSLKSDGSITPNG